ncbi:MAG: hypothetical protein A3E98_04315 [Candidatus Doudnabacteria bacterium RIFCSPHIGHO2_12_FULL_48_11]|nr:MAG: hypothetical protein A3E98_04315 [Candidatus Doudnabacteria bacterium RIFCSPHIGHO2_12_FULL_48_11]
MRPELLNRIDKILVFRPLTMEEIKKIAQIQLNDLADHVLKQQNIQLAFERELVKYIADKSFDAVQGARLIRKKIQETIEDPLAEKIISGEILPSSEVRVSMENGSVKIRQLDLARA